MVVDWVVVVTVLKPDGYVPVYSVVVLQANLVLKSHQDLLRRIQYFIQAAYTNHISVLDLPPTTHCYWVGRGSLSLPDVAAHDR